MLSGGEDGFSLVWDVQTAAPLLAMKTGLVYCVHTYANGTRGLTAAANGVIGAWSLEDGELLGELRGHRGAVYTVATVDGTTFAVSGSSDNTLRVWDLTACRELYCLSGHGDSIFSVCPYSADHRGGGPADGGGRRRHLCLSGSYDATVRLWDVAAGEAVRTGERTGSTPAASSGGLPPKPVVLSGHAGAVYSVHAFRDGMHALSGSYDWSVRLWDLHRHVLLRRLKGHT